MIHFRDGWPCHGAGESVLSAAYSIAVKLAADDRGGRASQLFRSLMKWKGLRTHHEDGYAYRSRTSVVC